MLFASCAALIVPGRFSLQAIGSNATVSTPFNITAPGLITLAISGQLQCGVQITSPVQSLNATPQFGSGGPFTADPNINGGNGIKTSGAYYGANPNPGIYTIFQLNVQSFTLPTLNGQIICGDSLPTSGTGTGPTGAPGPAATISGSPPVVATQPTSGTFYISLPSPFPSAAATACGANVTVTGYTVEVPICATDSPGPSLPLSIANGGTGTAAPAPTGANGCTVGTFPSLVVSCPSAAPLPSVTATACAGAPNLSAGVLSIPAGCQSSPVPSPLVTSTACAAAPGVSGATIEIPAGCGGAQSTPSPTASGGIAISGSFPYTIFASPAVPQSTPSPTVTSTACAGAPSASGSFPYTLNIPAGCSSGGTGIVLTTPFPAATPSVYPPASSALGIGQLIIGDAPFALETSGPATPSPYPSAILIQNGVGQCESTNYAQLGTSSTAVAGVVGQLWSGGCPGGAPFFTIGGHGDFGAGANYYSTFGFYANSGATWDGNTLPGYWMEFTTSTAKPCGFYQASSGDAGWAFGTAGTGFGGTCGLGLPYVGANTSVCTGSSAGGGTGSGVPPYQLQACNSSTTTQGQVSCTLSTLACTQTATVASGAICVASLDTTATTGTLGLFTVVSQSVSSTTLTITFEAISGASGTVAADYHC